MTPALAGTGLLADDLYLTAHNETTGRPYLQPRPLGLGLAAALLAELVLAGIITIRRQADVAVISRQAPTDLLARDVVTLIRSEYEPRPLRDWLLFLSRTAAQDVAFRLQRAGYLVQTDRRFPRRAQRWVPAESNSAFAPLLRACSALDADRPLTIHPAVLAGLSMACGLGFRVTEYASFRTTRRLEDVVGQLHPVLGELICQTQAVVDSAVLSHRA
jgi:uncharacterized protein (TIGR04222 family)